jgi:hypothetical protein
VKALFITLILLSIAGYHAKVYFHSILVLKRGKHTDAWMIKLIFILLPIFFGNSRKDSNGLEKNIRYSLLLFWSSFFLSIIAGIVAYRVA